MKSEAAKAKSLANLNHGSLKGSRLRKRSDGLRMKASRKAREEDTDRTMATGAVRSDRDVNALFDAKKELKKHSPAAIAKLVELLDSRDERVAFSAAREILDRNLGKPQILDSDMGAITITWGSPPIDQPKDITPSPDWNQTMAAAVKRFIPAARGDENLEDETIEQEN